MSSIVHTIVQLTLRPDRLTGVASSAIFFSRSAQVLQSDPLELVSPQGVVSVFTSRCLCIFLKAKSGMCGDAKGTPKVFV
jgi:hypothetical protein